MRGSVTLKGDLVTLRSIHPSDLEFLRLLKNSNKHAFFHKDDITPAQQQQWYEAYLQRPDDFMFVVDERLGCLGARLKDGGVDCYNIMAAPEGKGKGVMKKAMRTLTDWAKEKWGRPISLLVVPGNDEALGFYSKCGFTRSEPGPDDSRRLCLQEGA